MSVREQVIGWIDEVQYTLAKIMYLASEYYTDVNDVIIPTTNGLTQIGHIIVAPNGVFVVETKNMDGLIFGDEKNSEWTQSVFGTKSKFQNPLFQNSRHIKALSEFLGIEEDKFHSLVMFTDNCEFKTTMPPNVMNHGYISYIKSKTDIFFSSREVRDIVTAIKSGMLSKTWKTRR